MNLEKEIFDISLQDIIPNRFQPREMFDDNALQELAQSIKEHGVIQPIIVRKVGDKYEIIAGERRFRASHLAGKETIPALVRDIDDKEAAKIALLENLQRSNLTPIEEAKTYQTILKLDNITQEELAQNLGKSQSTIANKLRLLTLDEEVQTALLNSQISERHARSLIGLSNSQQTDLLHKIINEKLTVRQLDEEIMRITGKIPENDQITAELPNTQEGRISMDQFQSPVVPTPSFDNSPQDQIQAVPNPINPVINSQPEYQQAPTITENTSISNINVSETAQAQPLNQNVNIPETNEINQDTSINIPGMQASNQDISNEVNNVIQPVEQVTPNQISNDNQNQTEELHKTNIFDKLRVQPSENSNEQLQNNNLTEDIVNTTNIENPSQGQINEQIPSIMNTSTIIQSEEQAGLQTPDFNNIYDLRFAINNFRQAIQNTEKFGFKVKAEEYDSENKYQIVIEIDKKN